jgi:hypothetical protein
MLERAAMMLGTLAMILEKCSSGTLSRECLSPSKNPVL